MIDQLIFLGFNSRVVALNRDTGELAWDWRCPKGSGFTTVMLDGDRLIASVMGYTYCLDPATGNELWRNELRGMGLGVPSLASVRATASNAGAAEAEIQEQQHPASSTAGM